MLRLTATPLIATAGLIALGALTGCAQTVSLTAADDAENAGCAEVMVRLPDAVGELPLRETNAQGTGAWGSPASVLLRCGVAIPDRASTLPCVLVEDVYWLRDDADAPNYVFTTYGREPATEVIVNRDAMSPGSALYDLVDAVGATVETAQCTEIEDSLGAPTPTETPVPTPAP
ncbi:DUF3515 family protein [Conyzicola sp.]|uniref:DUF3515 family protein n=1 Tax=Conyzicola sp. TaxID=1969404 RepID=UPI003989A13E